MARENDMGFKPRRPQMEPRVRKPRAFSPSPVAAFTLPGPGRVVVTETVPGIFTARPFMRKLTPKGDSGMVS